MLRINHSILWFLLLFVFIGCEDSLSDRSYCFVGDSIIARWLVDQTLPSQEVYNYGKSGAGIKYIAQISNKFVGQDVIVMIGTNDYSNFYRQDIEEYAKYYLVSVSKLTDKNIYLYSLLPREFPNDPQDINRKIADFNTRIKEMVMEYDRIQYVDVFADFMDKEHINYQYYSDGLHLNIYGYELLSSKLLNYID